MKHRLPVLGLVLVLVLAPALAPVLALALVPVCTGIPSLARAKDRAQKQDSSS